MPSKKELLLISHLRNNAREPMTRISKKTKIPVSTIFDKLRDFDGTLIKKHTCLLNFKNLGFDVKAHLLFKVAKENRDSFQGYITHHERVNNVFRINNGFDFMVEAVFRNLQELNEFYETVEDLGVREKQEHFILEDIAREQFMSYQPGFETLTDFSGEGEQSLKVLRKS